jgi:CheY-like chemotaxis protein
MISVAIKQTAIAMRPEPVVWFKACLSMTPSSFDELRGCRILIANDLPVIRDSFSILLRTTGADVVTVENGQVAVDLVLAAMASGTRADRFDVVLMDLEMPVLNGYDAMRILRQNNYRGTIITITGESGGDVPHRCLEAGCNAVISKLDVSPQLTPLIQTHWRNNA